MSLLTLENNTISIKPDTLSIKVFSDIWKRDKAKTKDNAIRELSYVYYVADFKSIYKNFPEEEREEKVIADIFEGKKWKPDVLIKKAIDKYRELNFTPLMGLLEDAEGAINKLREYFREVDPGEAKDIIMNMSKLGTVVAGIKKLKEEVDKDVDSSSKIKGGDIVGAFEDPEEEFDDVE